MAILPANVLIDNTASDWLRSASALVLEYDLSPSRNLVPTVVDDESAALANGAAKLLRVTVEERNRGAWIQATVRDVSTQRSTRVVEAQADSRSNVITALNEIAKSLDANAASFSTSNVDALKKFSTAVESRDTQQRLELLQQAIDIAPSFGLAYTLLIEGTAANSPQSSPAIAAAQAHQNAFDALDRARIAAVLAKAEHEPLPSQVRASKAVLQVDPNDVDALVTIGSAHFLEGDAGGGNQLLLKALQVSGNNPNVRRQLAEGLVETKQFAQAEKFAADAPDAAICLLLGGDPDRANAMAEKAADSVHSPDLAILFRATWLAFSGQFQAAANKVQQGAFSNSQIRAIAFSQAALWELLAGDVTAAQNLSSTASNLNPNPGSLPTTARLLTQPNMPVASWRAEVEAASLTPSGKQAVEGYGLFLHGNYSESAEFWQEVLKRSGNADLRARTMLAASLKREGRGEQAKSIRVEPFLPGWTEYYDVVSFSEMRKLLSTSAR